MLNDSLFSDLCALLLDMDGVLWRDEQPIGDLAAAFHRIERLGLQVMLLTNNATRSVSQYVERLARFGVSVPPDAILTAGLATVAYLQRHFAPGTGVYVIGEPPLEETIRQAGFVVQDGQQVEVVVVAFDRHCTYEKLRRATLAIRAGAAFIGTNPDRTFPTPEGLAPGAGALIAAVEAATDRRATIIGKPQPTLFQEALERLGLDPQQALVVGDRLETDIAGGQAAGCRTALVLTGVTNREQARQSSIQADWVAESLHHLLDTLEAQR